MNSKQKKFYDGLDKNLYYKVENRTYTHVQPATMTLEDIQYLMDQKTAGHNITEDSIPASTFLMG